MIKSTLTLLLMFIVSVVWACPVTFYVKDMSLKSVRNVDIVVSITNKVFTDNNGVAKLDHLPNGNHTVALYRSGLLLLEQEIVVNCNGKNEFIFTINSTELEEVQIHSKSIKAQLEETPFSVQVLEMKKEHNKGGDVSNVLNKTLGVKLRTDGSLGSAVQINLGGLQGKAVKIFKDGIPIELFGHGFNLGTIPNNMLDRVEIYKGVMPVYLASDALGGGINLVTRSPKSNFAEVSYEIASFNTHRATSNLFFNISKDLAWYVGANTSFNYSDNNYSVNAPFYNTETAQLVYKKTKRFHDAARSYYTETFIGIRDKSWVDDLRLTLIYSDFYKEIQNDAQMNKVYGEAFSEERNYTGMIKYNKVFFENKLKLNTVTTYSHFNTKFIDIATTRYNWDGSIAHKNMPVGEINTGNNQRLKYDFFSTRLNFEFELNENNFLEFSELFYTQRRKGSDPLGAVSVIDNIDVLTIPAIYTKNNMALAFRSIFWNKSAESIFAIKYYDFKTEGFTTDKYNFAWKSSKGGNQLGYLSAIKWNNDDYLLKLSYEHATRLPDEYEVFGDARMVKENLDLKPEKSHNINLNTQYSFLDNKNLTLSANLFYRRVKDIIFLQLDIPFSRFINYEESQIKGVEFEANYVPAQFITIGLNATYQDIRRINIKEAMFKNLEGSRIPNIPFLFGNASADANFSNVLKDDDKLSIGWNIHYTHRFFLKAIPKNQEPSLFGEIKEFQTSLIIPRDGRVGQLSNDAGVYYHFSDKKTSLSLECKNIGNVKLYDNFNVQRQGRSFHLKLVYRII